jgi:hypothetical protein
MLASILLLALLLAVGGTWIYGTILGRLAWVEFYSLLSAIRINACAGEFLLGSLLQQIQRKKIAFH